MKLPVLTGALSLFAVLALHPLSASAAGTIALDVDLTDAPRKIFHVTETIPVRPGALTLYYPKWIPGEHSPSGPLENVAGLQLVANGKPLPWRRDLTDMYAIHVDIPKDVSTLGIAFDFLSPTGGGEFGQSVSATPVLADLEWNQVLLYPAGQASRDIEFEPGAKLPDGWRYATALEQASNRNGYVRFKPVPLNTLVDSPLIAGQYFREVDLDPDAKTLVALDLVADGPEYLELKPEQITHFRDLVKQAYALFGSHHYTHYNFLLTLSDNTGHFGLEHHQSSDDRSWAGFFTDPSTYVIAAGLLPHEYVHSWNGKFRRPADLWTPDFNTDPMQDDLLWVYEGLTQYFGDVLTARSGLRDAQQYRDALALSAAEMDHTPGRGWRPLQDTADEAQILYYAPREWRGWRRVQDFYSEGELIWLDVDTKLRELSHGKRSMDDFARTFYGMDSGSDVTKTYSFDDVVAALNGIQPFDWAVFLRTRLDSRQAGAPLDGIARGGYKLVYTDTPSEFLKADDKRRKHINMMYSIGLLIGTGSDDMGTLSDVLWGSPAFKAGVGAGMKLIAVNGRDFASDPDVLKDAIQSAKDSRDPIRLLVRNQDFYATYDVDYHGGLKYPHLEKAVSGPAMLDAVIAPKK